MKVDFAIVGGGPAGLAVAIEAALAGRRPLVVERCRGPVDKACGEGLMPQGVARLRALGVDVPAWGTHPFVGVRYVDGDVIAEAEFVEGPGLGIRRTALEEGLQARADALGVERWSGTEAGTWRERADGVVLQTTRGEVEADWLVATDGLHSRIRKDAGFQVTHGARRFGVRRHYTVTPWSPYVEVHWGDNVEAYVTPVGPERVGVAFLWSGGKGDHDTFLARFPALAERLGPVETPVRGAGPFDVRVDTQRRGRVLLAGDAAGYLDPLTGEGVSLALHGAEALVTAVVAGRPEGWPVAWRDLSVRHLRVTALLLQIARRPWLRHRVIRALRRHPRGFAAFLALTTDAWSPWRALLPMSTVGMGLIRG